MTAIIKIHVINWLIDWLIDQLVHVTEKEIFMECVMLLLYCLIYQEISEYAYEKRSGEWFFWECTRFLCWLDSFSIHLQIILCYMNSFTSCFSTNFCIYFQSFRGLAGRVRWLLSVWFGFFRENFSNRLGLKSRII